MLRIAMFVALLISLVSAAKADIPPPYDPYGIGASLADGNPFPTIAGVTAGSPAAKAGVQRGDGVIAIDGVYSKSGAPFYWFARGLQGPQDSKVQLILLRGGHVSVVQLARTVRLH